MEMSRQIKLFEQAFGQALMLENTALDSV